MKFYITLYLLTSFSAASLFAASKNRSLPKPILSAPLSTSAKAQSEIKTIPKTQKTSSTDAQFTGILKLKDPRPQLILRDWKYFLSLKIQSLQPQGKVNSSIIGDFDLSSNPSTPHPSIEVGFSKLIPNEDYFINWGLVGQTGFSSETVNLVFPSGYSAYQNTHLNIMSSSIGGKLELLVPRFMALYFNSSARLGRIFYTQTSLNDLAQFSEAATFWSLGIGAGYNFYQNWQITTDYSYRKISQRTDLKIQSSNAEIGLKVIW